MQATISQPEKKLKLTVNSQERSVIAAADTPLLYVLHDQLELTGPRFGCGLGQCGSCTVIVRGRAVRSCVTPVNTVADLKVVKLWTSAGDDRMTQWYKANGFQPRALAMTDILTGLTTGMIDGLPAPPLAALAFQWNRQAPYMLDIGLAPVVGGTVIAKRTWIRIADADRARMSEIALDGEKRLRAEVPNQDRFAVALMSKQGLTVTKAEGPEWKTEANALARAMRGDMVPADIFDLALKERDAFRQRKAAGASR